MSQDWDKQIGGDHYRRGTYQHWDLIIRTGLGYLEGCATKYLSRWRIKGNPEEDLRKALHYVDKLIASVDFQHTARRSQRLVRREIANFQQDNHLASEDAQILLAVAMWEVADDLVVARNSIQRILDDKFPLKPVPLTEENHHAEREATGQGRS
jgi:hypothetical protein